MDEKRHRKKWPLLRQTMKKGDCSQPQLATPLFLSPHDILKKEIREKNIEMDEKRLRKKMALIKTDYEKGRLQPTPAGHPKGELLSTGFYESLPLIRFLSKCQISSFSVLKLQRRRRPLTP
jgi:hypothetical protein